MTRYRRKPVVLDAFQMTKENRKSNEAWPQWLHDAWGKDCKAPGSLWPQSRHSAESEELFLVVHTLNGPVQVNDGDWIMRGVDGELYPCDPKVFAETYEPVGKKADGILPGKFKVTRSDGQSDTGKKHDGCDYWVLDLTHDPFALPALTTYMEACKSTYPRLAEDLRVKIADMQLRREAEVGRHAEAKVTRALGFIEAYREADRERRQDPASTLENVRQILLSRRGDA